MKSSHILIQCISWVSVLLLFNLSLVAQDKPATPPQTTPPPAQTPPATAPTPTPPPPQTPPPSNQGVNVTPPPASPSRPATYQPSTSQPSASQPSITPSNPPNNYNNVTHSYPKMTLDTVERFIADPTPLKIIAWNAPSTGKIGMIDTSLGSVRPSLTASINENVLVDLNSWMQEGKQYNIPFQVKGKSKVELLHYFDLPAIEKTQKLHLYFEGIAWKIEIKLNGKFVGTHYRPFETWSIPINAEWLREKSNLLEVVLTTTTKEHLSLYPKPFLGIFRPCYLVTDRQLKGLLESHLKNAPTAPSKTVGIIAPYYGKNGYIFDKETAIRFLLPLKKQNIQHIHFAFPADKNLKELCALLDFVEVQRLTPNQPVCWINAYPYETSYFPFTEQFWLNENNYRTMHYGSIYRYTPTEIRPVLTRHPFIYVLLVLFPLVGMFLVKLLNPGFFYDLLEVLVRPRMQLDSFMDATTGNRGLFWILMILRVIILSIFLTLVIHYVQNHNQWHLLQTFNKHGLLEKIFYPKLGLLQYFIKSLILISAWAAARLFIIRFFSSPFRINNMYEGIVNLELISAYPMVFFLPLPLIFMNNAGYQWHTFFWWLQGIILIAYLSRQIYIYYTGMDRLFKLSNSVRLIYILVFVILPYIICL
ncbi:MAG: hypothetical protein ACKVTZ_16850 [Bacteroidia bacterium]